MELRSNGFETLCLGQVVVGLLCHHCQALAELLKKKKSSENITFSSTEKSCRLQHIVTQIFPTNEWLNCPGLHKIILLATVSTTISRPAVCISNVINKACPCPCGKSGKSVISQHFLTLYRWRTNQHGCAQRGSNSKLKRLFFHVHIDRTPKCSRQVKLLAFFSFQDNSCLQFVSPLIKGDPK